MPDYTLVEKMIPARVLLDVGIYLQSAAHLELAIWQIIIAAESGENTKKAMADYLEVKKVTRKLVQRLQIASTNCSPSIELRIRAIAGKIEHGLENRNLAAHGAFFFDGKTNSLMVSHFFSRGNSKADRVWLSTEEPLPRRAIREAINEIDTLLREAISIRDYLTG